MKKILTTLLLIILCFSVFAVKILVYETSDIHGVLIDTFSSDKKDYVYNMAIFGKIVQDARQSKNYDGFLLLDGGDIYQGGYVSNLTHGAGIKASFDYLGYDAVALGNHEFDWGVEVNAESDGTITPYEIGEFSGNPDIPVLACNIFYAGTDDRVDFTKDYIIKDVGGKKIAIIGSVAEYTDDIMYAKISPYSIDGDYTHLSKRINEIKKLEKPDVTILLAHDDAKRLASSLNKGDVDLVCGGHSHGLDCGKALNGISYMQGGSRMIGYAYAVIDINNKGKVTVKELNTKRLDTSINDVPSNSSKMDSVIYKISKQNLAEVEETTDRVIGYITTSLDRNSFAHSDNTPAGNWITSIMLRGTQEYGSKAAFYNSGGIRAGINLQFGRTKRDVTVGDIESMFPFKNKILVYELSGKQLKEHMQNTRRSGNYGNQVSGMSTIFAPNGEVIEIIFDDGTVVDLNDDTVKYRVTLSNYSATLEGSVFKNLTPIVSEEDNIVDMDLILDVLTKEAEQSGGLLSVDTKVRTTYLSK